MTNAGVPPLSVQVPLIEEETNDKQDLVDPPPLMNGAIRAALFQMSQDITTQAEAANTQAQAMMT